MAEWKQIGVRLPADLYAWLTGQARKRGIGLAGVVRWLLMQAREREGKENQNG